jgi:hypothetical protein
MTRRHRHDEEDEILRDGERMRVPMFMMDGWQRDMAGHFQRMRHHDATDAIATDAPAMVVDAYGGTDGLSRPGLRYLHAGHRSLDDAVLTTRRVLRDEALANYIQQTCDAWKRSTGREPAVPSVTGDARTDALLAYRDHLTNSWRHRS